MECLQREGTTGLYTLTSFLSLPSVSFQGSLGQTQPEAKGQGSLFFKGQSPRADCIWKVSRVSKCLTGLVLPSLPPVSKDNLMLEAEQPSCNLETANMRTEAQPKDGLVEGKRVCATVDITWSLYQPG